MNLHRSLGVAAVATMGFGVFAAVPAYAAPAKASASVENNTLTVRGTNGGDDVTLIFNPTINAVIVDFGDGSEPQTFARTNVTAVSVALRGGDDTLVTETQGPTDLPITADGGADNDVLTGGFNADTLSGGAGDDVVNGAVGDDQLAGNGGDDVVDGGIGRDTELLGGGDDSATWSPGDGSDTVIGGAGADELRFDGSSIGEIFTVSASGNAAVLTRNVGQVRMDLDGVDTVNVKTFGGADEVRVNNLNGTDVDDVKVDLGDSAGVPDEVADAVVLTGTTAGDDVDVDADAGAVSATGLRASTSIAGAEQLDSLTVNTIGGNDRVSVSDAAKAVLGVVVNLGSGQR